MDFELHKISPMLRIPPHIDSALTPKLKGFSSPPSAARDSVAFSGVRQIQVGETCSAYQLAQAGGLKTRPPNDPRHPLSQFLH